LLYGLYAPVETWVSTPSSSTRISVSWHFFIYVSSTNLLFSSCANFI
jgi:hypothetical protein